MELQTLVDEYAADGIGEELYKELLQTVQTVSRHYHISYSPTRRWDEDAFTGLVADWALDKLERFGQLEHFLLASQTLSEFRKGLAYSLQQYLISRKDRTALGNLFQRANAHLESDPRFSLFRGDSKKVARIWGLASWQGIQPYEGQDEELIAIGLGLKGFPIIRYRTDAKKNSPILTDVDLSEFMITLLQAVGCPLSLRQFTLVFKFRFNLLEAAEVSLEDSLAEDSEGNPLQVGDILSTGPTTEEEAVINEAATTLLSELSARQMQALLAYAQPGATLTNVAGQLDCSKSTIENEVRRALEAIHRHAETVEEAEAIYVRLLELLSPE